MLRQRAVLFRNINMLVDGCTTLVAFIVAFYVRRDLLPALGVGSFKPLHPATLSGYLLVMMVAVPSWVALLYTNGMYKTHRVESLFKIVWVTLRAVGIGLMGLVGALFFAQLPLSRGLMVMFAATSIVFLVISNVLVREFLRFLRARGYNYRTVLIVGTGPRAGRIIEVIRDHAHWGLRIVGCVDVDPSLIGKTVHGVPVIGDMTKFRDILYHNAVDEVAFALPFRYSHVLTEYLKICEEEGVSTRIMADFYQMEIAKATISEVDGIPMLSYDVVPTHTTALFIKQLIDTVGSFVLMMLLAPLFAAIATAIKLDSRGPVFFLQERVGLNKRRFMIYKFRTMVENADSMKAELEAMNEKSGPIFKIKHDPRVTRVGRILRKFSLDELPQIWNVFKGEMSFIGPRPPVPTEVVRYEHWQRRRLSMKPGISGLWQVSGRSDVDFDQWMKMDLEYIDNWSLKLDFKIFLKTFPVVLLGRGAY